MKALVGKSIILVLVSLFTVTVSAQRPDRKSRMTAEERASKQTEMMTKHLDLTVEQQAKVKEINLQHSQQMANQQEQARENRRQGSEKMKSQMETRDAELKQVLTPEQYEKWQEKRKETRPTREKGTRNKSERPNRSKK